MRGNSNVTVLVFVGVPVYIIFVMALWLLFVMPCAYCVMFFLGRDVCGWVGIGCCVLWCELCLICLLKFAVSVLNIRL